jgi:hypothetical protein
MEESQQQMQAPTASDHDRPRPTMSDVDRPGPTTSSVRREEHNLTTRETLQLFEAAGLSRNQRSIERYCADGKLDAFFDSDEQRYYISRASADRLIGQLMEIKNRHNTISAVGPAVSDGIRPATTPARHDRDERQESTDHADIKALHTKLATLEDEKKTLEEKNFTLSYEKQASDQVVTMMRQQLKEDRKEFFEQMDKLVKEIGETKQLVGELQTQLKQIAAPKSPTPSGATTGMRQITEAEVVDDRPPTTSSDTSPGRPPSFHPPIMDIREASSEELV